jgi:putative ABC transport system permease protein
MVRALDRKLWRDLRRMSGQALTIALVVACGVASYVTLRSAYASLLSARDTYYVSQRFADLWVHVKRAPESLLGRIEAIPGVATAETRLVETVMVPIEGLSETATARLVSLPETGEPRLNAPFLRTGRFAEPGRPDEAVVLESFALAHHLSPGSILPVVINGVERRVHVTGLAMSPEYVVALGNGEFAPDDQRFGVLWMNRAAIAPAFQLEGAFDDVTVTLQPGASSRGVADDLERLLAPYGSLGIVPRDRQLSNYFITGELQQLESYATIAPFIFLSVAAFLVNVVLSRLVHLQRSQIATLKALGYRKTEIGLHYLALVLVIVATGAAVGGLGGAYLGHGMLGLYARYYKFPSMPLTVDARIVATSVLVSVGTAVVGALVVVYRVARLPPAEAMQPEAPPTYRATLLERIGVGRLFSGSGRMVFRELVRRPGRLSLSCLGIAAGIAVVISGRFMSDALEVIIDLQFQGAQRDDVSVAFVRPVDGAAVRELGHLPGVLVAETQRTVPVRLRHGRLFHETAIIARETDADLGRVVEWPFAVAKLPSSGLLLTDVLARKLGITAGDSVSVEVLEGDRRVRDVVVTGLLKEPFGLSAHMNLQLLHGLLGEGDVASAALLSVDPKFEDNLGRRLKGVPLVASVRRRKDTISLFRRQTGESMNVTTLILTLFGCAIAVGVVYNNARIALSMRSRDLASLRVLGFTRREISTVLLGELAAYLLLSVPLGIALGRGLVTLMMSSMDPEMCRMPIVVTGRTHAFSVAVTLAAGLASGLVVRRKLDELDLVAVLKARE